MGLIVHMVGATLFLMNKDGFETRELDEHSRIAFNPIKIIDEVDASNFISEQLKDYTYFHQQAYIMFLVIFGIVYLTGKTIFSIFYIILKLVYSFLLKIFYSIYNCIQYHRSGKV